MEMPPSNFLGTTVQDIPTFMPSGSRFLERFDANDMAETAAASVRRSLPNIPIDKLPFSANSSASSLMYSPKHSFLRRHGPMIANVVLTAIVLSLFVSQAKSSEKMLPIASALLLSISALTLYQRYYYSPCLTGQPWVGYLSIGSLFTSMILLGIWIGKSK